MEKKLTLHYNGTDFTLEFTRRTVAEMEFSGFNVNELSTKPMILLPKLFAGAFKAHHRHLNPNTIETIYETIENRSELMNKLAELYNEPLRALLEDPEVDDAKKSTWEASW